MKPARGRLRRRLSGRSHRPRSRSRHAAATPLGDTVAMRLPLIAVLAIATLLTGGAARSWAQSRIVGPSVERFSEGGGNFVTLGLRRTDLARSGNGVDVAVGLVPEVLGARVLLLQVD